MPLIKNRYGKGRVRVMRIHRDGNKHEVSQLSVKAMLEDKGVALCMELLLNRRDVGAVNQRLGGGQGGRSVLRQTVRQFARRGLQFGRGDDFRDQPPIAGLRR